MSPVVCRKGKGKAIEAVVAAVVDDPAADDVFIDQCVLLLYWASSLIGPVVNSKGKGKAKEPDKRSNVANQEGTRVKPADGELEDEDEIFVDEPVAPLDNQESGINDDGKPFVYHEDLHKPR